MSNFIILFDAFYHFGRFGNTFFKICIDKTLCVC